jgi:large subunit ribosomal protein L1
MPNAKLGTLVAPSELAKAIEDAKKGQFTFRVDQGANLHAPLGKVSMSDEQIFQNFDKVVKSLYGKLCIFLLLFL